MVLLKCQNKLCNHIWDYKGNNKIMATCPDCMKRIKIAGNVVKNEKCNKA